MNPHQPIQTAQHHRQHMKRIQHVKETLMRLQKRYGLTSRIEDFGFHENTSTSQGSHCTVTGFPSIPVQELQRSLPSYCRLVTGENFNLLIESPVSRRFSVRQYFLFILLIGILLLLLVGKYSNRWNVGKFISL